MIRTSQCGSKQISFSRRSCGSRTMQADVVFLSHSLSRSSLGAWPISLLVQTSLLPVLTCTPHLVRARQVAGTRPACLCVGSAACGLSGCGCWLRPKLRCRRLKTKEEMFYFFVASFAVAAVQPDRTAACASTPGARAGSRKPTWTNLFKYIIQPCTLHFKLMHVYLSIVLHRNICICKEFAI